MIKIRWLPVGRHYKKELPGLNLLLNLIHKKMIAGSINMSFKPKKSMIRSILAPTDFSDVGNNAVDYAVELAKHTRASVTLFHCFHIPVMAGESMVVPIPFEDLEKDSLDGLTNYKKKLNALHPEVSVDIVSKVGFAADEIAEYVNDHQPDLIVMGIAGSGSFDQLLGSISTAVAKSSKTPVLIVPPARKFTALENIVVAFDLKEIENTESVNIVLDLAKLFNSKITALNVREHEVVDSAEALGAMQANDLLEGVPHTMVNVTDDSPVEGIDHYTESHTVNLLAMIKRKHSLLDSLMHGSNTYKMAFHTHVPLLVLHE